MRAPKRTSLSHCLILGWAAFFGCPNHAFANLLLESEAGLARASAWGWGLDLRLGALAGARDQTVRDDSIQRYHAALGFPVRYRIVFITPDLEFQYVRIETNQSTGQLRSAKLHSKTGLPEGKVLHNLAAGGSAGVVLPAKVLDGMEILQIGMFVDGRTTLTATTLTLDELQVLYQGRALEMKDTGNRGAVEVSYRWWTVSEGAFLTLRLSEALLRNAPIVGALARPLGGSALSLAAGVLHFRLTVDVEVDKDFQRYVEDDQSQRISKDKPFLKLRYAVPLPKRFGLELAGSATKQNGTLLYAADLVLGVRF